MRIVLGIRDGLPIASKYARDLLRAMGAIDPVTIEPVWVEHRGSRHPILFREACASARELVSSYPERLVAQEYSTDTAEICERCKPGSGFVLAKPETVLSVLGYC